MSPTATGVPVIDISDLRGAGRAEVVAALTRAHRAVGFSQIVGHGIPREALDALFDASRAFQALPLEQRREVALNHLHRGFIEIDTSVDRHSSIETATRPNQSESFMVMREAGPDDPDVLAGALLAGPNQWPDLPEFRAAVEHYQRCVKTVAPTAGQRRSSSTPTSTPLSPRFHAALTRPTHRASSRSSSATSCEPNSAPASNSTRA